MGFLSALSQASQNVRVQSMVRPTLHTMEMGAQISSSSMTACPGNFVYDIVRWILQANASFLFTNLVTVLHISYLNKTANKFALWTTRVKYQVILTYCSSPWLKSTCLHGKCMDIDRSCTSMETGEGCMNPILTQFGTLRAGDWLSWQFSCLNGRACAGMFAKNGNFV